MKLKSLFHFRPSYQILALFLVCVFRESLGELPYSDLQNQSLCSLCGTTKTQFVREHCKPPTYHVVDRCCLNSTNQTLGIDLGSCKITTMPDLTTITDVNWINLANNPNLNCTESSFSGVFKGFQNLSSIILPSRCHKCPGGNNLWNQSHAQNNSFTCTGQLDNCHVMNRACPENSHCVSNGPGFYECLCSDNFTGYKCLVIDQGTIKLLVISLCTIVGVTILIIVPIYVLIRRRKNIHRAGYVVIE